MKNKLIEIKSGIDLMIPEFFDNKIFKNIGLCEITKLAKHHYNELQFSIVFDYIDFKLKTKN